MHLELVSRISSFLKIRLDVSSLQFVEKLRSLIGTTSTIYRPLSSKGIVDLVADCIDNVLDHAHGWVGNGPYGIEHFKGGRLTRDNGGGGGSFIRDRRIVGWLLVRRII